MKVSFTDTAEKQYKKLPQNIQRKVDKQVSFLITNVNHPSLRIRKMNGIDRLEARVDYSYRFTFKKKNKDIFILSIGPHDVGLGKK